MTATVPKSPRNLSGQAMGEKGLRTRRRIIDTTVQLLESSRLRDLRVAGIARSAGISTATFYLYFDDVIDVVLAEVEQLSPSTPETMAIVSAPWTECDALAHAHTLVKHYADFWLAHGTLFRVRNLAADEGDQRFVKARERLTRPLLSALARQVGIAQRSGSVPNSLEPEAVAGVLIAMVERVASILQVYDDARITQPQLIDSAAFLIAATLAAPQRVDDDD